MAESKNIFSQIGITPIQAILTAGGIVAVYGLGRKLGLVKGDEDAKAAHLTEEKIFEPNYLLSLPAGTKAMKFANQTSVSDIAKKIYDAKGFFKDDMAQLWGAIKRIKYKTQVSQVNTFFNQKYSKEMFTYMKTFLNADEQAEIWDYLYKLPTGL